jgi:hypothetical protein
MPNYKGHLLGGCVAFLVAVNVIVAQKVSFFVGAEWLGFTLLGALFPDIDIKSKGQKIFYKCFFVVALFLIVNHRFFALSLLSLLAFFPLMVPHRGICHRFWFVVGVPAAVVLLCNIFFSHYFMLVFWDAVFFIVGALSHLWLDLGLKKMFRF